MFVNMLHLPTCTTFFSILLGHAPGAHQNGCLVLFLGLAYGIVRRVDTLMLNAV